VRNLKVRYTLMVAQKCFEKDKNNPGKFVPGLTTPTGHALLLDRAGKLRFDFFCRALRVLVRTYMILSNLFRFLKSVHI
jgi:hypothetical protein